jgi:hypothetical protein
LAGFEPPPRRTMPASEPPAQALPPTDDGAPGRASDSAHDRAHDRADNWAPKALPWGDPGLWLALACGLGLQLLALDWVEGYQLADAAEYLDRAEAGARGEPLDPGTSRSFAFSALLVPLFWLRDLVGASSNAVVLWARVLQMVLGLAAGALAARAASRTIAGPEGRVAGRAAALFLVANPVFARWSISPLAETASLFTIALAVSLMSAARGRIREGVSLGLCMGAALLLAYKTIPILGLLFLGLFLERRWRKRSYLAGVLGGLGAMVLLQGWLDLRVYGEFGSTLGTYLSANFVGLIAIKLYATGIAPLTDLGLWLYESFGLAEGPAGSPSGEMRSLTPPSWYWDELHVQYLIPTSTALLALGLAVSWRKGRRLALICAAIVVISAFFFSSKGSKSFRLFVPMFPCIALLAGLGAATVWHWGRLGKTLTVAALVAIPPGSAYLLKQTNLAQYGNYWRGMDQVNAAANGAGATQASPLRVSAAYHWAARFRDAENVELLKLPAHIDQWSKLTDEERAAIVETIGSLDWFIAHQQALEEDPAILRAVNDRFEIVDIRYDHAAHAGLGPVYVLRERTGDPDARTFYELYTDTGPGEPHEPGPYQAQLQYPVSVDFRAPTEDGGWHQMVLLGYEIQPALHDGTQVWITFHFFAGPLGGRNFKVISRLTDGVGGGVPDNRLGGSGALPTSEWPEGSIVRQSYLTKLPYRQDKFGGPYYRGDVLPLMLWMIIEEYDAAGENRTGKILRPYHPSTIEEYRRMLTHRIFSPDALLRIGSYRHPVPESLRLPDDGRPIEMHVD